MVSKGVQRIVKYLESKGIVYKMEVAFPMCKDNKPLPFDVQIIVSGRIGLIEFDGRQHFERVSHFQHTDAEYKKQRIHDMLKTNFCYDNGISLLRICYKHESDIEDILARYIDKMRHRIVHMFANDSDYEHLIKHQWCCIL